MRMRLTSLVVALLWVAGQLSAQEPTPAAPLHPLVASLVGEWRMVGQVRGEKVTYATQADLALDGRFVEVRMQDVERPPQYEARLFIGQDTEASRLIAHWLDSFGGPSSIPHGTGTIAGETIEIVFAYPTAPFRDTITRRADGSWSFVIEEGDGRGTWKPFASYEMRRVAP